MLIKNIVRRKNIAPHSSLKDFPEKIQTIYANRGITSIDDLSYELKDLIPPVKLKDIDKAAQVVFQSIANNQSILIVGDFDADGATSTTLMMNCLKDLGAKKINFLVPDRFKFGYGLSVPLVKHAASLKPDLIITVDNGIANIDGVDKANELGIKVVITDHHLAGDSLPNAEAIVNPNQPDCEFPSKNIAGVGVAFYLMLALRALMRSNGWFLKNNIEEPNFANYLDIVALGTVADVVVLDRNNRIIVEQGLRRIRNGLAAPGIKAIFNVANKNFSKCQSTDLGFTVGPRLNAAGRLEDMSVGIDCLLAKDMQSANKIAQRLDNLNKSRKQIEQEMLEQATMDIEAFFENQLMDITQKQSLEERPLSLCLFDPKWHQGVIGILASRVKDKINRPVIIFAQDDEGDDPIIKGSARSVIGVHIRDVLALVDTKHPELIEKFGGHAMAAGLSIKKKYFEKFAQAFLEAVETHIAGEKISDDILTDGSLDSTDLNLNFAKAIRSAGPWGQGFPKPLFDDVFIVSQSRIVGENHLKLMLEKESVLIDGIFFRCPESLMAQAGDKVRLVYKLDVNEFRGVETPQLMIEQLEILND